MDKHIAAATIKVVDLKSPSSTTTSIPDPSTPKPAAVSTSNEVRILTTSEYKPAAAALAEAFATDHVVRYPIDTPDRAHWSPADRYALHAAMFEYVTYAHLLRGLVVTAGANYGCVALWMPPGRNMDDWLTIVRSGLWRLSYKLSAEGKRRFFGEFLPLLHETKQSVLGPRDDDSYYLVYIGTRPEARGMGLARKCVEFVTRQADTEGRACYLESSNDTNPIIYRRLGFREARKIELKRAEEVIELDIMVREPVEDTNANEPVGGTVERKEVVKVEVSKTDAKDGNVQMKVATA